MVLDSREDTCGLPECDSNEFGYGEQPSKEEIEDGCGRSQEESALDGNVELVLRYSAKDLCKGLTHILVVININ